jgi:hypothetical protein
MRHGLEADPSLLFPGYFSDPQLILLEYAKRVSDSIPVIVQDVFDNLQFLRASGVLEPE